MLKQSPPVDDVFKALSDPTRRAMVERLGRGSATVSELAQPLDMTLSAVVQHLAVLESCGVVRSEKAGRVRTCHIEPVGLQLAMDWFAGQRALWDRRLHRLGAVLRADAAAEGEAARHEPVEERRSTP
jgi:DNA-binding transcriptional ArsR family regulator